MTATPRVDFARRSGGRRRAAADLAVASLFSGLVELTRATEAMRLEALAAFGIDLSARTPKGEAQ